HPPRPPLVPYTTLFRSGVSTGARGSAREGGGSIAPGEGLAAVSGQGARAAARPVDAGGRGYADVCPLRGGSRAGAVAVGALRAVIGAGVPVEAPALDCGRRRWGPGSSIPDASFLDWPPGHMDRRVRNPRGRHRLGPRRVPARPVPGALAFRLRFPVSGATGGNRSPGVYVSGPNRSRGPGSAAPPPRGGPLRPVGGRFGLP